MQILLRMHALFQNIQVVRNYLHIYTFDRRRCMDSLVAIYKRYRNRVVDVVYPPRFD